MISQYSTYRNILIISYRDWSIVILSYCDLSDVIWQIVIKLYHSFSVSISLKEDYSHTTFHALSKTLCFIKNAQSISLSFCVVPQSIFTVPLSQDLLDGSRDDWQVRRLSNLQIFQLNYGIIVEITMKNDTISAESQVISKSHEPKSWKLIKPELKISSYSICWRVEVAY